MRARLAKLAHRSSQLRDLALQKSAGIVGAAVKGIGSAAVKNPLGVGFGALGAVEGAKGAKGKFQEYKAGFDPDVQSYTLGQVPQPPGA